MPKLLIMCAFLLLAAADSRAQESRPPLTVVPEVDLTRYTGTWYEIARLPNRFQDHCASDVTATYTLQDDGRLRVVNRCRKADGTWDDAAGIARTVGEEGPNARLKVRFAPRWLSFLPAVWGDYWIIGLAPDYSHAVVGDPDRKYLWVLARSPEMSEETLQAVLEPARAGGYDLSPLIRTTHTGQ